MIEDIKAVLLVGGLGTRLRSVVPSLPKPLASVGGRPFLELLVRQLQCQGISRLVMCTGYLADQIEREFGDGRDLDVQIEYSREPGSLGTAGAVKLAQRHLRESSDFLVLNGDSFVEADFESLLRFHRGHGGLVTMAVVRVPNAQRYGTVRVETGGRVNGFAEKTGSSSPGLVNAGLYLFQHGVLEHIPEVPASLERDVFPGILGLGVFTLELDGMFIDIGTPEDYAKAQEIRDRLCDAALQKQPGA
jgi:D-glycero-alpha-D-manno-heptose 1-phosphate guanylyltransferase